jgi:hypothetical protein
MRRQAVNIFVGKQRAGFFATTGTRQAIGVFKGLGMCPVKSRVLYGRLPALNA